MPVPYPAPDGSIDDTITSARSVAARCAARSGDVLPFITTANTARDTDRIRQALGEQRTSYFGGSYGTYLGAVFATLYPQHTDRMVLDSAVDPVIERRSCSGRMVSCSAITEIVRVPEVARGRRLDRVVGVPGPHRRPRPAGTALPRAGRYRAG